MRAVLGIDAAWTLHNPSGVALAIERADGWRIVAAESSYQRFMARAEGSLVNDMRPTGSRPDALALLTATKDLCGRDIALVAVDMPLARTPIVSRRRSDIAVSTAYGARKCATHSPSAARPGEISDQLRKDFGELGYPLLTGTPADKGLIEVYPHPALVELAQADQRLTYKASRARLYWPELTPMQRRQNLLVEWAKIVKLLEGEIVGVQMALPEISAASPGLTLKAYEDTLDAILCAWIAICVLEGKATAYGDHDSAIWIPMPKAAAAP